MGGVSSRRCWHRAKLCSRHGLSFTGRKPHDEGEIPTPCWRPNALNLGGAGAAPAISPAGAAVQVFASTQHSRQMPAIGSGVKQSVGGWLGRRERRRIAEALPPLPAMQRGGACRAGTHVFDVGRRVGVAVFEGSLFFCFAPEDFAKHLNRAVGVERRIDVAPLIRSTQ